MTRQRLLTTIPTCEFCGHTIITDLKLYNSCRRADGVIISAHVCADCFVVVPPKIICLCGSTRFVDDFNQIGFEETLKGNMVLSLAQHIGSDDELGMTPKQKQMLDRLHMEKIKLCHVVLVINRDGYIGESTAREIRYARRLGRTVSYLFAPPANGEVLPETVGA